ncbi:MAG: S9 family peptidase, partial [Micrococcales bacterium]|nr:S9 family peptidase [Micrococcales bacterium]
MTTIAPYGSWVSPISADVLAKQSGRLGGCAVARGGAVYFTRADPSDGGRVSLWRRGGDADAVELTPGQYVRSAINEYGGGAWAVDTDGDGRPVVVYSSWPSNELRVIAAESDEVLAPGGDWRYGSLFLDAAAGFVLAVREDHHGSDEAINTVVRRRLDGPNDDGGQVLLSGADFYANPTARDGRLAWTQWNHPNMPWDSSTILVAPLDDSSHFEAVSSGCEESAVCPVWAPDGSLI